MHAGDDAVYACRHAGTHPRHQLARKNKATTCMRATLAAGQQHVGPRTRTHGAAAMRQPNGAHTACTTQVTEVQRRKKRSTNKAAARSIAGVSMEVINKRR